MALKRHIFLRAAVTAILLMAGMPAQSETPPYLAEAANRRGTTTEKDALPQTAGDKLAGEWIVISAKGRSISPKEERPYLNFSASDHKLYGNLGCNIVNGDYSLSGKKRLSFSNVSATEKFCGDISDESNILDGISKTESYSVYKKDGLSFLDLTDKNGKVLIHAKRHNAYILSGVWKVSKIKKQDIDDYSVELVIDVPELKLHGNSGCNILNGSIGLDRNKDWFIQFQSIITSRMACDEKTMAVERDLLVALEEVEIIKRENDDTIKLLDKNNKEVLTLKKLDYEKTRK